MEVYPHMKQLIPKESRYGKNIGNQTHTYSAKDMTGVCRFISEKYKYCPYHLNELFLLFLIYTH